MKNQSSIDKYFKLFPYLHDDVKLSIISFCAHAPMETLPYLSSTLVSYRQINKNFQRLCDSDVLWKKALSRMCQQEPMFATALRKVMSTNDTTTTDDLLTLAVQQQHPNDNNNTNTMTSTYKGIYQTILNDHLRCTRPVFCMPGIVALGQTYSLHFFERRYRIMMEQLMAEQSESAKHGGPIPDEITFVHANRAPLQRNTPAVLVRIVQCQMYGDGRADVVLLPLHHVSLEKLWVAEDSGHLYVAQTLKIGRQLSRQLNQLQRQEALANVMDGLAAELAGMESSANESSEAYSSSSEAMSTDDEQQRSIEA